jgi:hypothetical protein
MYFLFIDVVLYPEDDTINSNDFENLKFHIIFTWFKTRIILTILFKN